MQQWLFVDGKRYFLHRSFYGPYKEYPGAVAHGKGPKSTPVIYSNKLFTLGVTGVLSAFTAADGKLLWQKKFTGLFPANHPPFGASMSPLVEDGLLIAHAGGHDGGALLALDPSTGSEKWSIQGDGPSYSSPVIVAIENHKKVVIQVHRKILGVDLKKGTVLWSIPFVTPCDQNIVTPLVAGNILVFSSLDQGTFGIRVQKEGGSWNTQTVWSTKDVSLYMSSPVLVENRIVGFSHKRKGQFFAMEAGTGEILWTSDARMNENAAIVQTGKDLLILKEDAELLVLSGTAKSLNPSQPIRWRKAKPGPIRCQPKWES